MTTYVIALIRGDGIGPEITQSAVEVLNAVAGREGFRLEYMEIDAGADTYRRTGTACSEVDLDRMRHADAILKGPVGLKDVRLPDGTEAGLLGGIMRTGLDTYANVRPISLVAGVASPLAGGNAIDYVIVRENTEGLYASRGKGVGTAWAVTDSMIITLEGTRRVVRRAFELAMRRRGAPADQIKRVTCVDKSNVLRSYAFFRSVFAEVSLDFPEVDIEYLYADAAAQALVLRPETFDVLVMENFLGDILSDLGGATVGGVALCPAANIGDQAAYFEPIHGSAPEIAGQGKANPIGQIRSAAMMLDHLGQGHAAESIEQAIAAALSSRSIDLKADGSAARGPSAAGAAIIEALA